MSERLQEIRPDPHALRVLIVDDAEINRLVLGAILDSFGVAHAEAADGRQALDAAMTGDFDVVLMDIQMPGMDGLEATRLIRAWEAGQGRRRIPIHMVSANGSGSIAPAMAAGADGFLHKPVSVAQVLETLKPPAAVGQQRAA
jgi:CheY-like chemotaxis protein